MVEPLYAFVDTNILLEFKPLEQIDWCAVLGAAHVVLVIGHEVIGELQGGKDGETSTRKKRHRAAARIKDIEQRIGNGLAADGAPPRDRLRDGVEWTYDPPPKAPVYAAHDLDRVLADDRLAAALLSAGARGWAVCLVSNDAGSRMRVRLLGIRAENLPEDLRLPAEPDPVEEELRHVKRELMELKSRQPKLSLALENGTSQIRVTLPAPLEDDDNAVERLNSELERICPEYVTPRSPLATMSALQNPLLSFNIGRYQSAREHFLAEMRPLVPRLIAYHNRIDLHASVANLVLSNLGSAPAEQVEVVLTLPPGVSAVDGLPKGVACPEVPSLPSSKAGSSYTPIAGMGPDYRASQIEIFARRGSEPTTPRLAIRASGARLEVAVRVALVRHAQCVMLPEFYIVFPAVEEPRGFTIEYAIHTKNPVPAIKGELNVIVQKLPDARPFTEMGARREAREDRSSED